MNNIYIGYDHSPKNLIPEADIVQHRLDFELDFSMTDEQLRHVLLHTKHRDSYVYTNSISLAEVLTQCKTYNIAPIICLNFFWALRHNKDTKHLWVSKITPADMARAARLLEDLLEEHGFDEAYLSVLNEPTKWLTDMKNLEYCRAVVNALNGSIIKILVGNDEFFPDMFDLLARNFAGNDNVLIGYHALSSMGTWKNPTAYIGRISMMKGLADNYGLDIIGNECGSWFVSYRTEQGHNINKQIIMECKNNGYRACLLVLPEINVNCINRYKLGYRVWDNEYKTLKVDSSYYYDFINFIKDNGTKPNVEEVIMAYLRPIIQQEFYDAMGWGTKPYHENTPSLPIVGRKDAVKSITWGDFDAVIETILKGIISGLKENGALPEDFPEPMDIKYKIDGSWNNDWQEIAKERIK